MHFPNQKGGYDDPNSQKEPNARRYIYVTLIRDQKFVFDLRGGAAETRAAISRVIVDMRNDPDFELSNADANILWGGASAVLAEMENDERSCAH